MATDARFVPTRMAPPADGQVQPARPRDKSRIILAHEPSISLGPITIEPAMRRLAHEDSREQILQPRVMQVLVALACRPGAILTRDELVERCWGGRTVGEDAINRVMSLLRRVTDGIAEHVFRIETITKVGYRLVLAPAVQKAGKSLEGACDPPLASAYVIVTFEPGLRCADVVPELRRIPLVQMIHALAGPLDLLIRLEGESIAGIESSRESIAAVEGVATAATYIVLTRHFG